MCLCAFVPFILILDFGLWICASAQPGVWTTHGPYTQAQTTAFFIDTTEDSRIYVATADQGVYVSESGGSSWDSLPAPLDTAHITNFIRIDDTLFAAQPGNLYFSDDGWSWTQATPPGDNLLAEGTTELPENFIINFNGMLYTGALWGSGLFTSSNGGVSWEANASLLDEYTISAFLQVGDTLFAATLENGVYYSADGLNWAHCGTVLENKSVAHLLWADDMLLAGGSNGLFISVDGITWDTAPAPLDTTDITLLYSNSESVYAAASGSQTTLFVTDAPTGDWTQIYSGEAILCLYADNGVLYAGTSSGLHTYELSGTKWSKVSLSPDPGEIVDFATDKDAFYALSHFGVYKTLRGQSFWFPATEITGSDHLSGMILTELYILAYGDRVYRSLDDGFTWETDKYRPADWGSGGILKIVETDNGFISAAGGIFYSPDGIVWNHLPSQLDQETLTTIIESDNTFLVGTAEHGIFYSSDGGTNWSQAGAPMNNKHVYFIDTNNNRLYTGTQDGLYVSDDSGITWQPAIPAIDSVAFCSFCATGNTLFAGTLGYGIYHSTDNGTTWIQSGSPMSDTFVEKLNAHNGIVFAGLKDNRIFLSRDSGSSWSDVDSLFGALQLTDFSHVDDVLFISTWDEKTNKSLIYRSIDSAQTWTPLNKNLNRNYPLSAPQYISSLNRLYTCGDGVAYQNLDLEPPVFRGFVDDTTLYTNIRDQQWNMFVDGADSMLISEDSTFSSAKWQEYQPTVSFTLSITDGPKYIYFMFKDFSYNVSQDTIRAFIILDDDPPYFTGDFLRGGVEGIEGYQNAKLGRLWYVDPDPYRGDNGDTTGWYAIPRIMENQTEISSVELEYRYPGEIFGLHENISAVMCFGYPPTEDGEPGNCVYTIYLYWYPIFIPPEVLNIKGIDFRILATDIVGNSDTLKFRKPNRITLDYYSLPIDIPGRFLDRSEDLPGGTDISKCRIISVPFQFDAQFPFRASNLGNFGDFGPDGEWMFWSYEGNNDWTSSNSFQLQEGAGYFLLLRDSKPIKPITPWGDTLTTVRTTASVHGEIPGWQLHANDWTLIGNPYRTRIEIGQLKLKNRNIRLDQAGTEVGIYAYTNAGWTQNDIALEPWSGLAVFLADSADVIVFANPDEPYERPPLSKQKNPLVSNLTDLDKNDWLVQICAQADNIQDNTNYFGVRSDALTDHDVYDSYEPLRLPGGISVCFPHPDWSVPTSYTSDIRAVTNEGYAWPLQICAEGGTAVLLHFETLGTLPDNFQMCLIDEVTTIARDLRTQPQIQVRIPEESDTKIFKIIVGTESFVEQNSDGLNTVPKEFVLYQNYPNPFNPVTVIRYALPVEGEITLKIYDVLGRVVQTPEQKLFHEPGYYEALIDMSDVASGIYFYRFHVDGVKRYEDVKKMVFLR